MILTYLDIQRWKFFLKNIYFSEKYLFFCFGHLQRATGVQTWTKSANFGVNPVREKIQIFQKFLKQYFCLLKCYLRSKFQQNLPICGPCMNVDLVSKTLKSVNLATTVAILMKFTTIVYLNKIFYFLKY